MSISVLRTADAWWVATPSGAAEVATGATTTAQLLADRPALEAAAARGGGVPVADLDLVSPVTAPCRVVAQMTNYASHVEDTGGNPATVPLTFFRKTSGSLSGPYEDVLRPAHVRLLDYEVEIGLVIGREIPAGTQLSGLAGHVAGLVVTNDISARDLQLPQTQFYESKSYPTFTPAGPALVLLDGDELDRFPDLRLRLSVNGEIRQDRTAADMIHPPAKALRALTRFQRLDPGDLILTGTPAGTALSAPPKPVELIGSLLPPALKWKLFFRGQARNPRYLKDGDVIETTVATDDGAIDLGTQRTVVRWAR
ncbi:fumarylacetoacetate hydrolase family protein [Amycolatopsis jiangsuensis]|uniref:2-keto-4-pentenoate hydratase/2-oxohepta-3-ene-1,7-dioic acid hydratase in catechol pathway n=1 Tax=Amycolatopsis jiangsuensis TaxID=1181879 RepID=A0A840J4R4_9PSEU|nr:fumarylacetoacetate hydrolase family protein [Amycolatopsis jiangsuensis]MBB4688398.1 2-keto-4-pentenoate hydratase/2-oxohepta-3-ene-1,7-dioic acid hydratase in catechol pathway [Amycolatopsis jiangsuensis]